MTTLAPAARVPRRPKLRSSCDACGAAKLKCSREPECQRCQTLGIKCTYSISRKMGKPPRSRPKVVTGAGAGAGASSTSPPVNLIANPAPSDPASGPRTDSHVIDAPTASPFEQSHDNSHVPMAWNPPDEPMLGQLDAFFNSLVDPLSTPPSNPNRDFYGEPLPRTLPDLLPKPSSPRPSAEALSLQPEWGGQVAVGQTSDVELESVLASVELGDVASLYSGSRCRRDGLADSTASGTSCTPLAEAYSILGQLALLGADVDQHTSSTRHTSISISTESAAPSDIPLDRILHLSQEAREKLGHILRSACLQAPLAFLCASIVSTILRWYQQITASMQNKSYDGRRSVVFRDGTVSIGGMLPPASISGSSSPQSGTAAVPSSASSLSLRTQSSGSRNTSDTVALRKISIGTFSVDDSNTETVLTAQVLLSELARLGATIDLFAQENRLESMADGGDIVKSVHSWLVRLHMQTVDGVRELSKSMLY